MRTVFVFPAGERAETVASLDRHLPQQRDPWTLGGNLYIEIDDEQAGSLFSDWEPDDVAALDAAIGHHPTWAVVIDISGRIDGTPEVHQVTALLLEHGGMATDDYSAHPWTLRKSVRDPDQRPALLRLPHLGRTRPLATTGGSRSGVEARVMIAKASGGARGTRDRQHSGYEGAVVAEDGQGRLGGDRELDLLASVVGDHIQSRGPDGPARRGLQRDPVRAYYPRADLPGVAVRPLTVTAIRATSAG